MVTAITGAGAAADPNALRRQEIWIQAIFHVTIAFFSYQVVARLAEQAGGGRLGESLRADLEKETEAIEAAVEQREFSAMLSGKHDRGDALLAIHAGQNLTDTALDMGFATPSHFSASFRNMFGVTASAALLRQPPPD